ncbi:GPI mannosyltransferase 2 [Diutina catenulata]
MNLAVLFAAVKAVQLAIVYVTPLQFDTSSQLVAAAQPQLAPWVHRVLDKFITWDAVYFNHLYVDAIHYEHEFVFCPLWWRLIKAVPYGAGDYYKKLVVSLVVSNLFHALGTVVLMRLTQVYFKRPRLAHYAGAAFILSPGGVFLTAGYSENFSNFLGLFTIYLHEVSVGANYRAKSKWHITSVAGYVASGLVAAANIGVRANTVLVAVVYLYDLYQFGWVDGDVFESFWVLVTGGFSALALLVLNWVPYRLFCPQRGAWCGWTVPSLFSFAQSHYWNVGFLQYWTPNNIPNFLFALPTIVIQVMAIRYFWRMVPTTPRLRWVLVVNVLLLVGGVFFWNVQILTRISSFLPLQFWYVAMEAMDNTRWGRYMVLYSLVWIPTQTMLFAAFLPPA